MAVRPIKPAARPATQQPRVKDVDDKIAESHGKKKSLAEAEKAEVREQFQDKPVARKPGHVVDTPGEIDEEHIAEAEVEDGKHVQGQDEATKAKKAQQKKKAQKSKETRDRQGKDGGGAEDDDEPPPQTVSLQELAGERRVNLARERGFQQTPSMSEVVHGKQQVATGPSFAELLPEARAGGGVQVDAEEIQPPQFLSQFEAKKDIYTRVKGRASPRTKELLEGVDLEDLVKTVTELLEIDELRRNGEARLKGQIFQILREDPGPLLLGLNDERLAQPWRLFVDGWDIWVPKPDSELDEDESGVELFLEGEGEDDDGEPFEILQSLIFKNGELRMHTQLGDLSDEVTFDGETFFRLKKRR